MFQKAFDFRMRGSRGSLVARLFTRDSSVHQRRRCSLAAVALTSNSVVHQRQCRSPVAMSLSSQWQRHRAAATTQREYVSGFLKGNRESGNQKGFDGLEKGSNEKEETKKWEGICVGAFSPPRMVLASHFPTLWQLSLSLVKFQPSMTIIIMVTK